MEATEEELFAGACKIEVLLPSGARDGGGGAADRMPPVEGAAAQNFEFGPSCVASMSSLA